MPRGDQSANVPAERDCGPTVGSLAGMAAPHYLENGYSVVGWPISPGLYAGRIGDRVKIGQSMNMAQRVDSFKFEELIGLKPFVPPARRAMSTRRITPWPSSGSYDPRARDPHPAGHRIGSPTATFERQ